MDDLQWQLTMQNSDDPHGHSARASQRTATRWDVEYLRGDEVVSTGSISTPPPHMPPMATLIGTLQELRTAADYWARRAATAPEASPERWP